MPSWKKRDSGRNGRSRKSPHDEVMAAPAEAQHGGSFAGGRRADRQDRIERLNRSANAFARGERVEPQSRSQSGSELDAVATELDRLLSRREESRKSKMRGSSSLTSPRRERVQEDRYPEDDYEAYDAYEGDFEEPVHTPAGARWSEEDEDQLSDEEYEALERERARRRMKPRRQAPARDAVREEAAEAPNDLYRDLGDRIDSLREPQMEAWNMVREELGSLREAIGTTKRDEKAPQGSNAELRRLGDMVERLRTDQQDQRVAKEIRQEIADLKKIVGQSNVDGTLKTLENGYAHILQRLDELTRATIDPRALKGVTARLSEIEDAFASLPRGDQMSMLDNRVTAISKHLEGLLASQNHEDIEAVRNDLREVRKYVERIDVAGIVETIDERIQFVSSRLDDLETLAREQEGFGTRLAAMEERLPDADVLDRLQGQLSDILGMMGSDTKGAETARSFTAMDDKLQDIASRLERIEQTRVKVEAPAGGVDSTLLGDLQSRIADLSKQLDRPSDQVTANDLDALRVEISEVRRSIEQPASTGQLEQRIDDLARLVADGVNAREDDRMDLLSNKVSALADQLNNGSAASAGLEGVTAALSRIEERLDATQRDVVTIARDAAREVLENAPQVNGKSTEHDAAIKGLQSDLRKLLDAAEGNQERTLSTFNDVQKVLGSVTDRLDRLERSEPQPAQRAERAPAARDVEEVDAEPRGFAANLLSGVRKQAEEPEPEVTEVFSRRPERRTRDERPQETRGEGTGRDKKADFIAAARRAAQAASEEAEMLKGSSGKGRDGSDERAKSRGSWLRSKLKREQRTETEDEALELGTADIVEDEFDLNMEQERGASMFPDAALPEDMEDDEEGTGGGRRKVLLFTAAAVILALGSFQVYDLVTNGGDQSAGGDQVAMTAPEAVELPAETPVEAPALAEAPAVETPTVSGTPVVADNAQAPDAMMDGASAEEQVADAPRDVVSEQAAQAVPSQPAQTAQANVIDDAETDVSPASQSVVFAPPSASAGQFGETVNQPSNDFVKDNAAQPSVSGNLLPEAIGPLPLRQAAANGDPAAAFLIGVKYTEGQALPADLAEAAKWYQKAAENGLAPAQYRLASLYEKGRGVEKDSKRAREWYLKAAEAGNAKAMHNLAVNYAEGGAGEPDFTNAAKWFEAAANYGVKDSLFNLGILYARGLGVGKDLVSSYKWFAIAAAQGDRDASQKRDDVANMMDQETLARARKVVEDFKMLVPEEAANKVSLDPEWEPQASRAIDASIDSAAAQQLKAMVLEAQNRLNDLGFDAGTPDGQIGPRTQEAIRAFQRSMGKPETGTVSSGLIDDLVSESI